MSHDATDEMHGRFDEWLAQGAHGDPPRDAAVHAFVCPECQRQMAALDALAEIDPGRATMPPSRPAAAREPRSLVPSLRVAGAAAGMLVVALVVSFGASRMLAFRTSSDVGTPPETPVQAVLGGEGSPGPSIGAIGGEASGIDPSPTPAGTPSDVASAAPRPSDQGNAPAATRPPAASQPPIATQPPRPTAPPTQSAAATPTRRPSASPSASASASVKPSPTSTPAATPTPAPTPTAAPTATPEPTATDTPPASAGVTD